MKPPGSHERGVALLQVVLLLVLVTATAAGAAMLARAEVLISYFHRSDRDAAYAAQAILAAALLDLDRTADWNGVLEGGRQSAFTDGSLTTPRQVPGGGTVLVCCGAGSLTARAEADTGLVWRPFCWDSLSGLLRLPDAPRFYLVAWVADDHEDSDGDVTADMNDMLLLRVEAVAPPAARRVIEVLVERAPRDAAGIHPPGLRILSWREGR
jgi:hypothetical protein